MSSAYGKIERATHFDAVKLQTLLPIERKTKSGRIISIHLVASLWEGEDNPLKLISYLRDLLNYEIQSGNTYPQKYPLSLEDFQNYFLSGDAFVALDGGKNQSKDTLTNLEQSVLGTFYIKPNFPGRCSHICNGGFITAASHRNQGVGRSMALAFLDIAPVLGYKASMFNLVFANNVPSIHLWRSLNFQEIGRIPKAGYLLKSSTKNDWNPDDHQKEEYVDAIMFYYDFHSH